MPVCVSAAGLRGRGQERPGRKERMDYGRKDI